MNNMDDKVHNFIMDSQYRTRIYIFGIKISDKIEKLDQTFDDDKHKTTVGF
jgi:hypothetical protein